MKFYSAAVALFAAGAIALPTTEVEKRASVNSGALELIGELEGFRSNFYTDTVGHQAIGKSILALLNPEYGALTVYRLRPRLPR